MARIGLEKIEFYAYHGYSEAERKIGCRFELDIVLTLALDELHWKDTIDNTIDYEVVYKLCKEEMKVEQRLIETVALRIITRVKSLSDKIEKVFVRLKKIDPPIRGHIRSAFVEIER